MTEDFASQVTDDVTRRTRNGLVNVYFRHRTLTPDNVRAKWENHPIRDVPAVGQPVVLPGAGEYGDDARWTVVNESWKPGAVTLLVDYPEAAQRREDLKVKDPKKMTRPELVAECRRLNVNPSGGLSQATMADLRMWVSMNRPRSAK